MKSLIAALGAFCVMLAGPAFAGTTYAAGADIPADAASLPALKFSHAASAELRFGDLPSLVDEAGTASGPAVGAVTQSPSALAMFVRPSSLPEPSTWAAMLAGFGIAGASLRRGRTYRLVERSPTGETLSEEFPAPDDDSALERALSVADCGLVELWRGSELVQRFEARPHAQA